MKLSFWRRRKLRTAITSLFLAIKLGALLSMAFYIFHANKQLVVQFAGRVMTEIQRDTSTYILTLFDGMKKLAEIEQAFVLKQSDVSVENDALVRYMFEAIKSIPDLTIIHVGSPNGSLIALFSLLNAANPQHGDGPLPESYKYALLFVDRFTEVPTETWYYLDKDGRRAGKWVAPAVTYDPRTRPWFEEVIKTKKQYWTQVNTFPIPEKEGITFATPLFDSNGSMIAIAGADIELTFLSKFLLKKETTPNGKLMVITKKGQIVSSSMPEAADLSLLGDSTPVFNTAYQSYSGTGNSFPIFTVSGTEYLTIVAPLGFQEWLLAIAIPANDVLGGVFRIQNSIYLFIFVIMIISTVLVTIFARRISAPITRLSKMIDRIRDLHLDNKIPTTSRIREIFEMQSAISAMQTAFVSFKRYVPTEIVRSLLSRGKAIELGGERKMLTIFFSDVYNFTSIVEGITIEELTPQLAAYFDAISRIILEHQGTIDKYIGDAVMGFWGAPLEVKDHPFIACDTALLVQETVNKLNSAWEKEKKSPLKTRIGLHTGTAIVGNIGTEERMNYTIMGDSVNLTARLENANKIYHTDILVSRDTYDLVHERYLMRPIDIIKVKGKEKAVEVYELFSLKTNAPQEKTELCTLFEEAYRLFHDNKIDQAREKFMKLRKKFPEDVPTGLYLERCKI